MSDDTRQQPTLVLGGTGKIGRRVAQRLTARGLTVRIGSRSGEPCFDWEDRSTAVISRAVGRGIRYVPISIEDFAATAAAQGVPSGIVEMLTLLFGAVLDRRNARLGDGVQRALGRDPRDFSDYARDAAATGIWNRSATRAA